MPFDAYDRPIQYLRVSVTDRCNLRCVYCMPEEGVAKFSHQDILRNEEIVRIVRLAVETGFVHIRLTGGEPRVRQGVGELGGGRGRRPGARERRAASRWCGRGLWTWWRNWPASPAWTTFP